ncbi:LLM class flavin-dependent oxidoreductase [Pseudonocardia sp. MCCB 268]|nr:LLM class flavin-dependent oxidoreductase [Pseudonocardia cytotoxica]
MSALVRHQRVAAMELGGCANGCSRPRRGPEFELGLPALMNDGRGSKPSSQLGALRTERRRDGSDAAGRCRELHDRGGEFSAQGVKLTHPPASVPPIYTSVLGPKMVRLSGEIADSAVVSAMASAACTAGGCARTSKGAARPYRAASRPAPAVTFAMYSVADDIATARASDPPARGAVPVAAERQPTRHGRQVRPGRRRALRRGGADTPKTPHPRRDARLVARRATTVAGDPVPARPDRCTPRRRRRLSDPHAGGRGGTSERPCSSRRAMCFRSSADA